MRRVSFWIFVLSFISPFFMYLAVGVWLAFLLGEEGGIRVISAGSVMSVCVLATPILWVISAVFYVGDKVVSEVFDVGHKLYSKE